MTDKFVDQLEQVISAKLDQMASIWNFEADVGRSINSVSQELNRIVVHVSHHTNS